MEKCATPLVMVLAFSRNDEDFLKPFGFTENIFRLNLFEFHLVLWFGHPHFKFLSKFKHDAHMKLA